MLCVYLSEAAWCQTDSTQEFADVNFRIVAPFILHQNFIEQKFIMPWTFILCDYIPTSDFSYAYDSSEFIYKYFFVYVV